MRWKIDGGVADVAFVLFDTQAGVHSVFVGCILFMACLSGMLMNMMYEVLDKEAQIVHVERWQAVMRTCCLLVKMNKFVETQCE